MFERAYHRMYFGLGELAEVIFDSAQATSMCKARGIKELVTAGSYAFLAPNNLPKFLPGFE